jgi:hypothetical protein
VAPAHLTSFATASASVVSDSDEEYLSPKKKSLGKNSKETSHPSTKKKTKNTKKIYPHYPHRVYPH